MTLEILDGGFLTTIQDAGRRGYERFGVPPAGAMDSFALAAANLLVGNPVGDAALEMAAAGPSIYVGCDCLVALTGGGFRLLVNGSEYPSWMSVFVRSGSRLDFPPAGNGQWGYLALSGGLAVEPVLGSRSTYLRGSFGGFQGRALRSGDRILLRGRTAAASLLAGRVVPSSVRPDYRPDPLIRVILGSQSSAFTEEGLAVFLNSVYFLSLTADRMGCRLNGPPVAHRQGADILSDGIVTGAVQVPADGQPLVLMSDRQTTGGYTKIGAVALVDLPVLAQCRPGASRVRFVAITVEEAQRLYRAQQRGLRAALIDSEEDQLRFQRS